MELQVLSALQFEISVPSAYRFLERFIRLFTASDDHVFFFAQYILEIALLDASLLKHKPSELAAASLLLAARGLKRQNKWNLEIELSTGIKEDDLE